MFPIIFVIIFAMCWIGAVYQNGLMWGSFYLACQMAIVLAVYVLGTAR